MTQKVSQYRLSSNLCSLFFLLRGQLRSRGLNTASAVTFVVKNKNIFINLF